MNIDELLIQEEFWYPSKVEEIKRNDETGKVLIRFKSSQLVYSGEIFNVPQVLVASFKQSCYGYDVVWL